MARGVSGPSLSLSCPFRIRVAVTVGTPIPEGAYLVRPESAGSACVHGQPWVPGLREPQSTGRPCTLTVPQEENEVLSSRLDGLQLLSSVQGLCRLAVPEVCVLLLDWPRGEGKPGQSWGSALCGGRLGGASLPGMMPRTSCGLRPSSSSSSIRAMLGGWWEGGKARTPGRLGPQGGQNLGTSCSTSHLGLSRGRTLTLAVKGSTSLPLPQVATLAPPRPVTLSPAGRREMAGCGPRAGVLEKAGLSSQDNSSCLPKVGWGFGGMSPLGEEHLPCPHRGQSQPFAHTVLWENHYSYVHLICSVFF